MIFAKSPPHPFKILLMAVLTALTAMGCSLKSTTAPEGPSESMPKPFIKPLQLNALKMEAIAAETFFYSGRLLLNANGGLSKFHVLTIADLKERQLKIEVTHPWGKPLFHLLLRQNDVDLLLFSEKRHYHSQMDCQSLKRHLPVPLKRAVLWSLARAFPVLSAYDTAQRDGKDRLVLKDARGRKVQMIDFDPETGRPCQVRFLKSGSSMRFRKFEAHDGMTYARQMDYKGPEAEIKMDIQINQMVFNPSLPKTVFDLNIPKGFTTFVLRDHREL